MKRNNNLLISLALLASMCLPSLAFADDTEIFFNENILNETEELQPNVLFIFDTSGSMTDKIKSREPYDPDTIYCPDNNCNDDVYIYQTNYVFTGRDIVGTRINCKAMLDYFTNTPESPVYNKKAAQWNPSDKKWENIARFTTKKVECQEDSGIHGIDDTATELYARNGKHGPYTTAENKKIKWGGFSDRLYVPANYHYYRQTVPTVTRQKTDIMKEAAVDLIKEFNGLNVALMRFDGNNGGYVKHHFSDIETSRPAIINNINELTAAGNTPLTETLWEAHKYYLGGSVEYGTNKSRDPAAVTGKNYNSPVAGNPSACQKNYVVYLTDGEPTQDSGKDTVISNLPGVATCKHTGTPRTADATCLDDLAGYMARYDYNDAVNGVQNVVTHTIGFDIDTDLLVDTAKSGKGSYHTAASSDELKTAFNEIIFSILSTSSLFTAPAVSVNAYNSLQNKDELYYALFAPNINPRWTGNIKKYRISSSGDILDQNDDMAIDPNTGYFEDGSHSFWGSTPDGREVTRGGAANQLTNTRKIYTVSHDAAAANISLNALDNTITLDNAAITNEMYGIDDDSFDTPEEALLARTALISWMLGIDVDDDNNNSDMTDANKFMADPLHSRPIVVTYDGDNTTTEDVLFATTNAGALHAVNASNGAEIFSFIPQDLLPNQLDYYTDDPDGVKRYGLDGPMTVWRKESADEDIKIDPADGDHVYLYVGMRRGGNNYYALDVTNTAAPKLMWTIFGGEEGTAGFKDLGETWSRPILQKVNWGCDTDGENCTLKDVLFFAGGYDAVHDNAIAATTGDNGAAIYMVDAITGQLLWSAGNNNNVLGDNNHALNLAMNNSIVGDVTVADMNGDGAADILFAVDILGHVWRVDFNSGSTSKTDFAKNASGKDTAAEIADFSDSSIFRRFYVGPTVSLSQKRGRTPFFVLTMGTGYTAHPKDLTITDRLYAMFESNIFGVPTDESDKPIYTKIGNSDLLNLTPIDENTPSLNSPADPSGNAPDGFYKDAIAPGEKFLRSPVTLFGTTLYNSYLPEGNGENVGNECGVGYLGGGRIYAMDFVSGESAYTTEYMNLKHPGIPPEPVVLFLPDGDGKTKPILCVGTECFEPEAEENPWEEVTTQIQYWRENTQSSSSDY